MSRFSVEAVFSAKDGLSPVVAKISGELGGLQKKAGGAFGKLSEAAAGATTAVVSAFKATAVGVTALGGALALAAKPGADFEEAITAVGAVSLMTRGEIADLEKKALELGASTKFSATEVASAMEMMGRAGFTNAETMVGIGGILNAAAAEGAGLAETASNVSNVLKGMGLAAGESGRVADVLTLASARTNSSISSLGESMKNVASTARTFGIPMEEAVSAVALLQDVGIDASEAGSAVNTMLTQMAAPTKKAAAQMAKLGISFKDTHGNMLPLTDVFGQFEKAAQKSGGNMEQVAFFAELVGLRGQKAAVNLKDLFKSGKFTALAKELDGAAGSAEKMAKLRMNNLKGDLEQLGGAIETVQIGLFNTESGPLRRLVQGMNNWVDANSKLIQQNVGQVLDKLIEAFGQAKFAFDLFTAGFREGFSPVLELLKSLAGPSSAFSKGLGTWPQLMKDIGVAAGVFGTVVLGIKGVETAMKAWELATIAVKAAQKLLNIEQLISIGRSITQTVWMGILSGAMFLLNAKARIAAAGQAIMTAATEGVAAASAAADLALLPLLATIGAVALAVGSLILVYQQMSDLLVQTGGAGGLWEGVKSFAAGDGFFKGMDAEMNRKAREESVNSTAGDATQTVSPHERTASAMESVISTTTTNKSELVIKDQTGGKAKFTKPPPKGGGIALQPSGGM